MAKVTMPQLGESVAEGTIGKWLKKPGDSVAKYEPLLEVITDKVNAEVPSPFEGILKEILVEEGATVPNNAEIAIIETADEGAAGAKPNAEAPKSAAPTPEPEPVAAGPTPEPATGPAGSDERGVAEMPERAAATMPPAAPAPQPAAPAPQPAAPAPQPAAPAPQPERVAAASAAPAPTAVAPTTDGSADDGEARMTPAVRRLLREHGLAASQILGTGTGGRITREDVTNYVESQRTGQPVNGQTATRGATSAPAPSAANAQSGSTPGLSAIAAAAPSAPSTPAAPSAPSTPAAPSTPVPAASSTPAPAAVAAPSARGISGQQVTFPEGADEVLVPMTQMRKGIANQMTRALQVPHAYVQVEVDATRLWKAREKSKRDFQAKEGTSLSFVPFVVKAAVNALKRNPAFNATWTDQGLLAKRRINMGVAVAVPDGLIVPIVHDVDQLSIAGINRAIAEVAARARNNRLRLDDLQGSTFTIDNTGWFGSNITLPIINVPEVAILTMENITKRPVVVETEDGDTIAIRPVMNMVLGIDHRANDGAQAAAFLNDIKGWLESIDADLPIW